MTRGHEPAAMSLDAPALARIADALERLSPPPRYGGKRQCGHTWSHGRKLLAQANAAGTGGRA